MAHAFVTTAYVKAGKLTVRNSERFDAWSKKQRDGEYALSVEPLRATRSLQFNRYYFACVVRPFAEHTGYTVNESHELLRAKHFPKDVSVTRRIGAIVGDLVIGAETKKLSHDEFNDYVMAVRAWMFEELDVRTEDPDPAYIWERERAQETT